MGSEWEKAKTALTVSDLKHIKLHHKDRKSRSSGGKSFLQLKNKWSHIPYKVKIYFTECDTKLQKRENVELRTGIEQEKSKRIKLEKSNTLDFVAFAKIIIQTQNKHRQCVRQKQRVRNRLKEECMEALTFFGHYDLIAHKNNLF